MKLDNNLNFIAHIDDLCKKVSRRIAVLKKIKRNLLLAERKLYYNAIQEKGVRGYLDGLIGFHLRTK